jgi:hypothetical protein
MGSNQIPSMSQTDLIFSQANTDVIAPTDYGILYTVLMRTQDISAYMWLDQI